MGWTISRSWGGIITEEPAVVSWGPRRLDVFARGGDGRLHHWWGDDDRWGGPEPLGRVFADVFHGSPHAVSWAPGRLDIFARAVNGSLMHWWFERIWGGPESLGGFLTDNPCAVSWAPNRLDVFGRAWNGELQHWWFDQHGWHGPESLGGYLDGPPHAVSLVPGRLDIFGRGRDQTLQHWWFENAWGGPESLGGRLTDTPHVASWAPGRLDVFARGDSGALQHWWFDAQGWHGPENLSGSFNGSPDVTAWGPDRLDVYARSTPVTTWPSFPFPVQQLHHWDFDVNHNLPLVRPSLVFDRPGDNIKGVWAWRAIVARDVTLAGWLKEPADEARGYSGGWDVPGPDGEPSFGCEDWHYDIWLDPNFIDTFYDNHLGPLKEGLLTGNELEFRIGVPVIPLVAGRPTADTFTLPAQGLQDPNAERPFGHFTVELNAWHMDPTPGSTSADHQGRGPAPDGWVPDPKPRRFANNRWPFNPPVGSDAAATPLQPDDYVIVRGTLWQDSSHALQGVARVQRVVDWDDAFPNHAGWLEIHPVDSIRRASPPPGPRKDVQVVSVCAPPNQVRTQSYDVYPAARGIRKDGQPNYVIGNPAESQTLWYTELIDPRFTRAGTYRHKVEQHRDHLRVEVTCQGTPFYAGTFKATYLLLWGPIMM